MHKSFVNAGTEFALGYVATGRLHRVFHLAARLRFQAHEMDDLGDNGLGSTGSLRMGVRTTIAPIMKWPPLSVIARCRKDITFAGEDKIGSNKKFEIQQT